MRQPEAPVNRSCAGLIRAEHDVCYAVVRDASYDEVRAVLITGAALADQVRQAYV